MRFIEDEIEFKVSNQFSHDVVALRFYHVSQVWDAAISWDFLLEWLQIMKEFVNYL